jgi:hypothetical protein
MPPAAPPLPLPPLPPSLLTNLTSQFLRDSLLGANWLSRTDATDVLPYMRVRTTCCPSLCVPQSSFSPPQGADGQEVIARIMDAESLVSQLYDDADVGWPSCCRCTSV